MKRFTKKILSAVLAMTLVIGLTASVSAASWDSYFGQKDWYEFADGTLSKTSSAGFTANVSAIGWGGVWGLRIFQKGISVSKGTTYNISFNIKVTKINKFAYIKIANGDTLADSFWVKIPKNKNVTVNRTFKAANSANELSFGLGGESYDRTPVADDHDAATRYKLLESQLGVKKAQLFKQDCDGAYDAAPQIVVSKYSLVKSATKISLKAPKAKGKKKVKVSWKKAAGIKTYEVKVGKVKKKTTKTSITVKAKKKGKQKVQVRGISADKTYKTKWATKKVKVK